MYHKRKSRSILSVALIVCVTCSGLAVGRTLAKESILFTRNSELYAIDSDGTNVRQLLDRSYFVFESAWSPDGRRIAFVSGRDRNAEIYVMNIETGEIVNLTGHPARDRQPAWSPDGSRIAFVSNRNTMHETETDIYVMNTDGTDVQRLTDVRAVHSVPNVSGRYEYPSWSVNGNQILFIFYASGSQFPECNLRPWEATTEIYVMDADGTDVRRLTHDCESKRTPVWSSDGRYIAFQHVGNIAVMDADGTNLRVLTNRIRGDWDPTWSPDSKQIAFQRYPATGAAEIFVINVDGTNLRNLTNHPANDAFPNWSRVPSLTPVSPRENRLLIWGWLKALERRF